MASSTTLKRRSQRAAEESAAFGPIAERFRRAGDLDRAVSLCREGLQKFPHHISARVTLGWSLLDQGKYDEARVELEQVLRRAPDNLAAIRGLAELHDRAEHTLNLPMDGPGQWPPDEQSLNEAVATDSVTESVVDSSSHDALATAVQFTAEPEEDIKLAVEPERVAVFTNSAGQERIVEAPVEKPIETRVETDVEEKVEAKVEQQAEHQAEPEQFYASAEAAEQAVAHEAVTAGEPMAEPAVELFAESAFEEPVAEAEMAAETDAVSEADIAALIAEAERLEAEAAATEVETQIVHAATEEPVGLESEVAGEIDLEASEDVELAAAEPVAEAVAEVVAEPVAEEVVEQVAEAIAEPVAEPVAEVIAEPVAEEVVEAVAEPEPVAEEPALVAEDVAPEPVAEIEPAPVSEVEPAPMPVAAFTPIEMPAVVHQPVEPAASAVPMVQLSLEPVALPDGSTLNQPMVAAAIVDVVRRTHLAEIIPLARAAKAEANGNTLVALERLLVKVQARRRELMAQSVA